MADVYAFSEQQGLKLQGGLATSSSTTSKFNTDTTRAALHLIDYHSYGVTPDFAPLSNAYAHCVVVEELTTGTTTDTLIAMIAEDNSQLVRWFESPDGIITPGYYNGSSWVSGTTYDKTQGTKYTLDMHYDSANSRVRFFLDGNLLWEATHASLSGKAIKRLRIATRRQDIFSEVIVSDKSTISRRLEVRQATANGTDMDGGIGSYTDIDEAGFSDSDVVVLPSAGNKRSFTSPARTFYSVNHTPSSVSINARLKREETGPLNVRFYLTIGGTRYYSPTIALQDYWDTYYYAWGLNPATGLAWVYNDAQAATLEWGFEALA